MEILPATRQDEVAFTFIAARKMPAFERAVAPRSDWGRRCAQGPVSADALAANAGRRC
jgi:hypothetical protein